MAMVTAFLGPDEAQPFAQNVEQRHPRIDVEDVFAVVDRKAYVPISEQVGCGFGWPNFIHWLSPIAGRTTF